MGEAGGGGRWSKRGSCGRVLRNAKPLSSSSVPGAGKGRAKKAEESANVLTVHYGARRSVTHERP